MAKMIVTIDGPAASGKSTVARLLAEKLGASFLDTGAMYRAVTLAAMQQEADMNNQNELLDIIDKTKFKFSAQHGQMLVSINDTDVTDKIRQQSVTANSKYIASAAKVRTKLVEMQRQFTANHEKIVTEGRDQGTVAFADANIKFYLNAHLQERAKRRLAELTNEKTDIEQIKKEIEARDNSDQKRATGPLKAADDAIVVDTTDLTIKQVVEKLYQCVKEKCC